MAIKVSKAVKEMRIRLSTKAASCVTAIIASQKMAGEIVPIWLILPLFASLMEIGESSDGKEEKEKKKPQSLFSPFSLARRRVVEIT